MNIAIDLDGTLAHWRSARAAVYTGAVYEASPELGVGEWVEGAREAVTRLMLSGHHVVVQTCRATWTAGGGYEAVAGFLRSGGFVPVPVVGLEEFPTGGQKRTDGLKTVQFSSCSAANCHHGLVSETEPCPECFGNGVVVSAGEVGIWVGRGKPVAHWYIDDRAIPFDLVFGWENALTRFETITGEPLKVLAGATA